MIRYRRGDEPETLTKQRRWRLARLKLDWLEWCAAGNDPADRGQIRAFVDDHSELIDKGYDDAKHVIRETLRHRGELKCVWCEADIQASEPIDHLRPRRSHPPRRDPTTGTTPPWDPAEHHDGYWWLAWSWENLLPTCVTCNLAKSAQYPLDTAGARCGPFESPDDDTERPLLIDPSREDPAALIHYLPVAEDGDLNRPRRLRAGDEPRTPRFLPDAIDHDPRAERTLKVLKLRSGKLDDNWEKHLRYVDKYDVTPFKQRLDAGEQGPSVAAAWDALVAKLVSDPDAPRRALTRAFLDHRVPAAERQQHGLADLPALTDPGPPEPRAPLFEASALRARDEGLALAVEACGSGQRSDLERAWKSFDEAGDIAALAQALGTTEDALRHRLGYTP